MPRAFYRFSEGIPPPLASFESFFFKEGAMSLERQFYLHVMSGLRVRSSRIHGLVFAWILFSFSSVAAFAQAGTPPFAAFPTQNPTDGRFLGFGCSGLSTLEQSVHLTIGAPASSTTFTLNVFDGETGRPDSNNKAHWDLGSRQLKFALYADPLRTANTDPGNLIGSWVGNGTNPTSGPLWTASSATMADNDWWSVELTNSPLALAPSGNYSYNLTIGTDGSCNTGEQLESSLKIAVSSPASFRIYHFALVAGLRQVANDVPIIYPGSTPTAPATGSFLTAPTTYDGTFDFFFTLPGGESALRLFDGDFDYGTGNLTGNPSGVPLDPCVDQDDPDTPADYAGFPFATPGANPEGTQGVGVPPDDNYRDIFRRGELGDPAAVGCVRYEVMDPEGNVYSNDNPSGSSEWEQYLIASSSSPDASMADAVYSGATLPSGMWKVRIIGLDLANLNLWSGDSCSTRPERDPLPEEDPYLVPRVAACPDESAFILGDTVWEDADGDGSLSRKESGIPNVAMELVRRSDGAVVETTLTGDVRNPNWSSCLAHNTGNDLQGLYCFGVAKTGAYFVRVAASNFAPGGALEGKLSTDDSADSVPSGGRSNVLSYRFGFRGDGVSSVELK